MACISPFGLLRVAALPIGPLLALAPPVTAEHVDAAASALDRMAGLRPKLEDALYAVVPSLDARTRAAALEIRRSVHNDRSAVVDAERLADVLAALPEDQRRILSEWLALERACAACLAAAEAAYRREIPGHVHPSLRALTADEAFLRPLALVSPLLLTERTRAAARPSSRLHATKLERSLLLYAARASAKTSPLSVFMHQALVEVTGTAERLPRLDPEDRDSRAYLDRGLLFQFYREAVAGADQTEPWFMLNPSIRWREDGCVEALVPGYVTFSTRLLRLGRPTRVRLHPEVSARLTWLPGRFSLATLRQLLIGAGLSRDAAERFSAQLQERGLVQPAPFATGFDAHPEVGCLAAVAAAADSRDAEASTALAGLIDGAGALPSAPSSRRVSLVEDARTDVQRARRALGTATDEGAAAIFWEDGFFRRPLGPVGAGIHGLLRELAPALRSDALVTAPYRALRDYFVEEHGPGGTCRDVAAFLVRASVALARRRWWSADPATVEYPAGEGSRVPITALVQFQAASEAALAAGEATVVLNQVYPGCGWMSARHAAGDADFHRGLCDALRAWLGSAYAPAEPVDVMLSGDCNALQAHPWLTRRVLQWPIEPCAGPETRVLPISRVAVSHDRASELLRVHDPEGKPLAPVHLGTTVPHPAWGPEFWLTTLGSPYRIRRPMEELTPPMDPDLEVLPLPRRAAGRVVLSRAAWWMRSDRMRRLWYRRSGAARLLDVAADGAALGMPRRVFIRAARSAALHAGADHKPLWIDMRNPYCLDVLWPLLSQTAWLFITEALPDAPVWPTLSGEPHVSELLVEMVL